MNVNTWHHRCASRSVLGEDGIPLATGCQSVDARPSPGKISPYDLVRFGLTCYVSRVPKPSSMETIMKVKTQVRAGRLDDGQPLI